MYNSHTNNTVWKNGGGGGGGGGEGNSTVPAFMEFPESSEWLHTSSVSMDFP